MASNNSRKARQDTYESPRMLSKSEIELLQQDMEQSLIWLQQNYPAPTTNQYGKLPNEHLMMQP